MTSDGMMSEAGKPFTISPVRTQMGTLRAGELVAEASHGNYVDAAKTVALLGVENLVIVDTPDALLVTTSRSRRKR